MYTEIKWQNEDKTDLSAIVSETGEFRSASKEHRWFAEIEEAIQAGTPVEEYVDPEATEQTGK